MSDPPRASAMAPALILVAAVAENGVIGRGGGLPWRLKSDLRYSRALTMGKPVVMGRKTYLSIGKPLDGRTNIVVSRNPSFAALVRSINVIGQPLSIMSALRRPLITVFTNKWLPKRRCKGDPP